MTAPAPTACPPPVLVLASASPRRRQLLCEAGVDLVVDPATVDETARPGESAAAQALRLAVAKADAVAPRHPGQVVLGADTVVVLAGTVYGKPADLQDAARILGELSGRWHEVLTGVALVRQQPAWRRAWVCRTRVRFKDLPAASIAAYCALANPLDKAGAYGIQEHGDMLVAEIDGLRSNVVGLPVEEVTAALRADGWVSSQRRT
jgi:septum formation protein